MGVPRPAFLFLLFACSLLVAGCATQGTPATGTGASKGPKVQQLVVTMGPPTIEATVPNQNNPTSFWMLPTYDYLVGISPEGRDNTPMLAASWSVEPDGKSIRMKLRQGVQFHNGKGQFTAKDVVYSLKHYTAADAVFSKAPFLRRTIQDIEVVNDYEVVFRITKADSYFFFALSQVLPGVAMISKEDAESRPMPKGTEQAIAGTGPYQFLSWETGRYIRYEKAPYEHWRKTPAFSGLELRFVKEPSTRLAALLAREVQIADLPIEMFPQAAGAGFQVRQGQHPEALYLWGNLRGVYLNKQIGTATRPTLNPDPSAPFIHMDTPLLDIRVRRALSKAIDRDGLNKAFFGAKARTMSLNAYSSTRPGWDPSWERRFQEQYGYDPAKAKALLAEAGYGPSNPLQHEVLLFRQAFFPALPDIAEAMANYYRAVGIQATLVDYDPASFAPRDQAKLIKNMSSPYISPCPQIDCVGVFMSASDIGSGGYISLPDITDYYENILRPELDPQKADGKWRQLGNMLFDQAVNIPLFWVKAETVVDSNVVGDWPFPGNMIGTTISHLEYVSAAP